MIRKFFPIVLIAYLSLIFSVSLADNVNTSVTTTAEEVILTQVGYRWYENINSLTPITPKAGENIAVDTPGQEEVVRLRINVRDSSLVLSSGATFSLQYSNSTSSGFVDVGTSTDWVFYNNASVADGQIIVTTVLSDSDVGESYSESNPSAASPNDIPIGQEGEWDWVLKNNSADTSLDWYFRMINSSGTAFSGYNDYPTLTGFTTGPSTGGQEIIITGGGGVPIKTPERPPSPCDNLALQRVDLNGDCLVDLIDLSILLYYYNQSGLGVSRYDLDNSLIVDFADISVMMFYWTK